MYLYFLLSFVFTTLSFAKGAMPLDGHQWINGSFALAFFMAIMSLMMMVTTSSIMGLPLIRDIEYNTKEYYLSYPITKPGYFWGRYLASFLFVLLIGLSVPLGAYVGSKLGPVFGWQLATHYGPDIFINYAHAYLVFGVPNLFFSASLFFGLVAATKNIKVIYTSGALLMLGYIFANFLIHASGSKTVIYLADPFAANGIMYERGLQTDAAKNTGMVAAGGLLLGNRLLWTGISTIILVYTYFRFSFERFFSSRRDKKASTKPAVKFHLPSFSVNYQNRYTVKTVVTLTKIEMLNIVRDTYFWMIIGGGVLFLAMIDWHLWGRFFVPDFPRTAMMLKVFDSNFLIFIFCIIMFYTGETIHRERVTRYAAINDALPPSEFIFNLAKFLSLLSVACFLITIPMLVGLAVQLLKGYQHVNIGLYLTVLYSIDLPKCFEMVMFAFFLHICINNKFAALGTGIALWVLFTLAEQSGWIDYKMLLYSHTPNFGLSDMDGVGHMLKPVSWFNIYWLLFGSLLVLVGYLFFVRGTISSFKERWQLAKERLTGKTAITAIILGVFFLTTAGFIYYNVSYANSYYTRNEFAEMAAVTEKKIKHYDSIPLPTATSIQVKVDIYPEQQKAVFKDNVTLVNKTNKVITELLFDGDNITSYTFAYNGIILNYTNPLLYKKGRFNFLQPHGDSSAYRLYKLPKPMAPGDKALAEINSIKQYKNFTNDIYGTDILHNGTSIGPGLPGLGYDDDEELTNPEDRAKYGLPVKKDAFEDGDDTAGANALLTGGVVGLAHCNVVISVPAGQTAIGPGDLVKQWQQNDRNYFEYASNKEGMYSGIGILAGRYSVLKDSVTISNGKTVGVEIYYNPANNANLQRFIDGYKTSMQYYTSVWGPYPFKTIKLVETSPFNNDINSMGGVHAFSENFGWSADFTMPYQWDYCYYNVAQQLARQWWMVQVAPNHTKGSRVITNGLSKYAALLMMEKKYGANNIRNIVGASLDDYTWSRGRTVHNQNPVLQANRWEEFDSKAGVVLFGLKRLIGEDSINIALKEFYTAYAFKNTGPYAGSKELYSYIKKHVPDSLQYYLSDTWEKITFYDNKIESTTVTPLGNNQYKVNIKVSIAKNYEDNNGEEKPAIAMNDYIDIGVFAADTTGKYGYIQVNPLGLKTYKLTAGKHNIEIIVKGKPVSVAIDPFLKLIDKNRGDNSITF